MAAIADIDISGQNVSAGVDAIPDIFLLTRQDGCNVVAFVGIDDFIRSVGHAATISKSA